MASDSTALTRFFNAYERTLRETDAGASVALFADTFLAAGPEGAQAVPIAAFAPAIARRKELFARLGCRSTELVSLEEVALDSRYAIGLTNWRMTFVRPDFPDEAITVKSTFLVDLTAQRILVYLAHQDVFAVLRERGILTE